MDLDNVCALINAFRKPAIMNTTNDEYLAAQMKDRMHNANDLMEEVTSGQIKFTRRKTQDFSSILHFPELTRQDIQELTLGCYQINNAPHYLQDTFERDQGNVMKYK